MPEFGIEALVDGFGSLLGWVIGFWVFEGGTIVLEGMDGFEGDGVFADFAFLIGFPLVSVGEHPDDADLLWMGWVDFEEHGIGLGFGLLQAGLPDDAVGGEGVDAELA